MTQPVVHRVEFRYFCPACDKLFDAKANGTHFVDFVLPPPKARDSTPPLYEVLLPQECPVCRRTLPAVAFGEGCAPR